jgi:YhcH/YjgK/YiaL family protein
MVQSYDTDPEKTIAEAHKKYIDIQFMVKGEELIGVAPIGYDEKETEAKPENDVWFYECKTEQITLIENSFMVLYPNDLHCPGVATNNKPMTCKKVVVKVKV